MLLVVMLKEVIMLEALRSIPDWLFIPAATGFTWALFKLYVLFLRDPDYEQVPVVFSIMVFMLLLAMKLFLEDFRTSTALYGF